MPCHAMTRASTHNDPRPTPRASLYITPHVPRRVNPSSTPARPNTTSARRTFVPRKERNQPAATTHHHQQKHNESDAVRLLRPARRRRRRPGGGVRRPRRRHHLHHAIHQAATILHQEKQQEEEVDAAGAELDGAAAHAGRGRPLPHAGLVRDARLHLRGAAPGHAGVRLEQQDRGGRLRARLQGLPRRRRPQGRGRRGADDERRRQVPGRRRAAGPPRVAGGGGLPRHAAQPPAPGEARRLLHPGPPPHARLRVHGKTQPRGPPIHERAVDLAVGDEAEDRGGGGQGAGVPARGRHARHLQGLQGIQHPPRIGLHGEAVGLRAGQGGASGRRDAHLDPGDGHARLRGARVHPHGPPHGQERRLQLRRRPPRAAHGPAQRRQAAPRPGAEPRGLGAPLPPPAGQAAPRDGPEPRGQLLRRCRRQGRHGGLQLPPQPAQVAPHHARGRRRPRAAAQHARRHAHRDIRLHRAGARR